MRTTAALSGALLLAPVGLACGAGLAEAPCRVDLDCPGAAVCDAGRCLDPGLLADPRLRDARRVVLWPDDDAVVSRSAGGVALGATDFLSVGGAGSTAFRSYLRFDVGSLPEDASVRRAELRLRGRADPPGQPRGSCVIGVFQAARPWRGARMTWQNQPGAAGMERAWGRFASAADTEVRLDVTELVDDLVRGVVANHGFALVARDEHGPARLVAYSSKTPRREQRPWLEVLF